MINYLLEHNLATKLDSEIRLLSSDVPEGRVDFLYEGDYQQCIIVLCSLIKILHLPRYGYLKSKLRFHLHNQNDWWTIYLSYSKEYNLMRDIPFEWDVIVNSVSQLFPHMAGSNISYLVAGLLYDDKLL